MIHTATRKQVTRSPGPLGSTLSADVPGVWGHQIGSWFSFGHDGPAPAQFAAEMPQNVRHPRPWGLSQMVP